MAALAAPVWAHQHPALDSAPYLDVWLKPGDWPGHGAAVLHMDVWLNPGSGGTRAASTANPPERAELECAACRLSYPKSVPCSVAAAGSSGTIRSAPLLRTLLTRLDTA